MESLSVVRLAIFIVLTSALIVCSWRSLHNSCSHGFYRFFAFEGILALVLINAPFWYRDIFSPLQIVSWILLFLSIFLVVQGFHFLRKLGGARQVREVAAENLGFENTTELVTDGVFKYIRHPMYCSLMLFTWGVLLKNITSLSFSAALISTVFLIATAKVEEMENILFFGGSYKDYMRKTKGFIPRLF
ncbi:MAG: isoprenylcysteine carboxylmethyltransferase family protein [Spongiibacteraceae bacterium]